MPSGRSFASSIFAIVRVPVLSVRMKVVLPGRFGRHEFADNAFALGHALYADGENDRKRDGEPLGYRGDRDRNGGDEHIGDRMSGINTELKYQYGKRTEDHLKRVS